jgi:hypothetical protein
MRTETEEDDPQKVLLEFFHRNLLLLPKRTGIPPDFVPTIEHQKFETKSFIVAPTPQETRTFSKSALAPAPPTITSIDPNYDDYQGGLTANVFGTGFISGLTTVDIGGNTAAVNFISDTQLEIIIPASDLTLYGPPYTALRDVNVIGLPGQVATLTNGFKYQLPPSNYSASFNQGFGTPVYTGTANLVLVQALTYFGSATHDDYTGQIGVVLSTFTNINPISGGYVNIINGVASFTVTANVIDTANDGEYYMALFDVRYPSVTYPPINIHITHL